MTCWAFLRSVMIDEQGLTVEAMSGVICILGGSIRQQAVNDSLDLRKRVEESVKFSQWNSDE